MLLQKYFYYQQHSVKIYKSTTFSIYIKIDKRLNINILIFFDFYIFSPHNIQDVDLLLIFVFAKKAITYYLINIYKTYEKIHDIFRGDSIFNFRSIFTIAGAEPCRYAAGILLELPKYNLLEPTWRTGSRNRWLV